MHFVEDFVAFPLLILNLGFLTGLSPQDMLPSISCSMLSTVGAIGVVLAPADYMRMVFCCMNVGFWVLNVNIISDLPKKAAIISAHNQMRCQVVVDLMVMSWSFYPLAQCLGSCGVLSLKSQLDVLALLDLLGKLGVSHIMLRSKTVLQRAAQHLENEPVRNN